MWQELQENCAINAPSGKSSKTAVLVILSMRSLVLHRTAEPQEALWHFGAQYGARDCQNCKTVKTAILPKMCQNCQKMCKAQKVQKPSKNSTFRVSQQSSWRSVCQSVLCVPECQSRPVWPRSLVQPSPAFSSWFQPGQGLGALPSCPEVQGECLAFRQLPREVTRPRSPSQCPGMCPGEAQEKCYFSP